MKLGWFSSGRGPGSRNLLRSVAESDLNVNIQFVFCNWNNEEEPNPKKEERKKFFDLVGSYNIPLVTLSWKEFMPELRESNEAEWRNEYGKEMRRLLSRYEFDIGILAGYMLWIDDETCDAYDLLNLHPALPDGPKGTWQEVIWDIMENDADEQGAMMHICTKDWDRGDAITYCGFSIRGKEYDDLRCTFREKLRKDTIKNIIEKEGTDEPFFKKIREDGAKRELPLIVSTIKQFADGTLTIKNKRPYFNNKKLDGPFDVSDDVDRRL
jgi:Folate-dependent phosphoribosylglycinamide formyltransferase PurN